MKKTILKFSGIIFLISNFSCSLSDVLPAEKGEGQVLFYVKKDYNVGIIKVYVENKYEGTITHFNAESPECGEADVNLTKKVGKYKWNAESEDGSYTWDGTIEFFKDGCKKYELNVENARKGVNMAVNETLLVKTKLIERK